MTITMQDIADKAGCTKQAVSLALRDHAAISRALKKKVRKIAKECGYVPNETARIFAQQKTHLIGIVIPDLLKPFFHTLVLNGISDEARHHEYHAVIGSTGRDAGQERKFIQFLTAKRFDALIMVTHHDAANRRLAETMCRMGAPLVTIPVQRSVWHCHRVIPAMHSCYAELLNMLHGKGLHRILHFYQDRRTLVPHMKHKAFCEEMEKMHFPKGDVKIVRYPRRMDPISLKKRMHQELDRAFAGKRPPQILWAPMTHIRKIVLEYAASHGIEIPGDCLVVTCFDIGSPWDWEKCVLVAVQWGLVGGKAVQLAIDLMDGGKKTSPVRTEEVEPVIWIGRQAADAWNLRPTPGVALVNPFQDALLS